MQILRYHRFPLFKRRPLAGAAALLHVVHAVLAVPVRANDLPLRAALLPVLRICEIFTASGGEIPRLHARLHAREPDDAELPLRFVPLALDFRALRICAERASPARRRLGHAQPDQADLQGDGKGTSRSARSRLSEISRPFFVIFIILALGWSQQHGGPSPNPTMPTRRWWSVSNIMNLLMAEQGARRRLGTEGRAARRFAVKRRGEITLNGENTDGHRECLGRRHRDPHRRNVDRQQARDRRSWRRSRSKPASCPAEGCRSGSSASSRMRRTDARLPLRAIRTLAQPDDRRSRLLRCRSAGAASRRRGAAMASSAGTTRFLRIALFQTSRGLSYFMGLYRLGKVASKPSAAE